MDRLLCLFMYYKSVRLVDQLDGRVPSVQCPCPPWFELFLEPNWCCGHNPLLINHQTWHNICGGVHIIPQMKQTNVTSWQIEIRGNSWVRLRFHKAVQFFWNKTHSTNLRNHMIPETAFLCVSMKHLKIAWFHSFTWWGCFFHSFLHLILVNLHGNSSGPKTDSFQKWNSAFTLSAIAWSSLWIWTVHHFAVPILK